MKARFVSGALLFILVGLATAIDYSYRLPDTLKPTNYALRFDVVPDQTRDLDGFANITVRCLKPTNKVSLHADGIQFISTTVPGIGSTDQSTADEDKQIVTVTLPAQLQAGNTYQLQIQFKWRLWGTLGPYNSNHFILITQFESIFARRFFPCFDEPAYKATFDIQVAVSNFAQDRHALSNMPVKSRTTTADGKQLFTYQTTPVMSTYLIAVVIPRSGSDFHTDSQLANPKTRAWNTRSSNAAELVRNADLLFQRWFNLSNPLSKIDYAYVRRFKYGAMENWGLIVGQTLRPVALSHETAHQWFGDAVTMKWWNDLFLNEGFATFWEAKSATPLGFGDTEREYRSNYRSALFTYFSSAALSDEHWYSAPISLYIYNKGCTVFRMIEAVLSDEVFLDRIQHYLKDNQYSNADAANFISHMAAAATGGSTTAQLNDFMVSFIRQPAYPVVTVTANTHGYHLTQRRRGGGTTLYKVPLFYSTQQAPRSMQYVWLTKAAQDFHTDQHVVEFNPSCKGLYLVDNRIVSAEDILSGASTPSWCETLSSFELGFHERDQTNMRKFFAAARRLPSSGDDALWHTFLMLSDDLLRHRDAYPWLVEFVDHVIKPRFERFDVGSGQAAVVTEIACKWRLPECVDEASRVVLDRSADWDARRIAECALQLNGLDDGDRGDCIGAAHDHLKAEKLDTQAADALIEAALPLANAAFVELFADV